MAHSSAERDPLDCLAEDFVARYRSGARPSISEYAQRHPDLATQIHELFPALVEMEQCKPGSVDPTGDFVTATSPSDPERVGEFRILRRIGHGGMGVVYEAVQESLGRLVALKLLPTVAIADPQRLERFRREARAAARLHHTNIVPVFGVGEADGRHYYAMQFISGHPLDAVIDEVARLKDKGNVRPVSEVAAALASGTFATNTALGREEPSAPVSRPASPPLSGSLSDTGRHYWEAVARIGAQVADGLVYAHAQGILHRDIKPANLLLDLHGTAWITDFGLAKTEGSDDLTHDGDIVGTLRYTAPERFDGKADARSDVYALGLTLYEMLTLQRAFPAENRPQLIEQVMAAHPPAPRRLNPAIPRDLETIVLKAIARDPALRYQSAAEMAEDLHRYIEDRPIRARRASNAEQAWRWCRRNPVVASLLATVLFVFATGSVVSTLFAVRAAKAETYATARAEDAAIAGAKAIEAQKQAQREASLRALDLGQMLLDKGEGGRGVLWLARGLAVAPEGPEGDDLRRVAWGILATSYTQIHTLVDRLDLPSNVYAFTFSPDGKYFAVGPDLAVYDTATRKPIWSQPGRQAHALAFTRDGAALWLGAGVKGDNGETGEIVCCDPATAKPLRDAFKTPAAVWGIALAPDGKTLLAGCADGSLRRWDLDSGTERDVVHREKLGVRHVAFSPDGKRFLTAVGGPAREYSAYMNKLREPVLIWDALTYRQTGAKIATQGGVTRALFTPDSKQVLIGGSPAGLWDAYTGVLVHRFNGSQPGVDISPNGKHIAIAGHDYKARIWSGDGKKLEGNLLFQSGWLWNAAFAPDGRTLVTGGYNHLSFWRLRAPLQPAGHVLKLATDLTHATFSADGAIVVVRQKDSAVRAYDTTTGEPIGPSVAAPDIDHWGGMRLAADGRTLLYPARRGFVRRWDIMNGATAGPDLEHGDMVVAVAATSDGRTIASGSTDGKIRLWDSATGKERVPHRTVFTGKVTNSWVNALEFAPRGHTLAAGTWHFRTYFWETPAGPLQKGISSSGAVANMRYSPDGRHLALGVAGDDVVTLHDAGTRKRVGPILNTPGFAYSLAFSPDGLTLATGCGDGQLRLWDVGTCQRLGPPLPCRASVRGAAFRGNRTLLTADRAGVLRWNLHESVPPAAERLQRWTELITGLALDEFGGVDRLKDLHDCRQRLDALGGPPVVGAP